MKFHPQFKNKDDDNLYKNVILDPFSSLNSKEKSPQTRKHCLKKVYESINSKSFKNIDVGYYNNMI